jgi:hypothetical protein
MAGRDFPTLLMAFLAVAATGAAVGGADEAKAQIIRVPCLLSCEPDGGFVQFTEMGFDEIIPFTEGFQESFFQVVQPLPDINPIFPF